MKSILILLTLIVGVTAQADGLSLYSYTNLFPELQFECNDGRTLKFENQTPVIDNEFIFTLTDEFNQVSKYWMNFNAGGDSGYGMAGTLTEEEYDTKRVTGQRDTVVSSLETKLTAGDWSINFRSKKDPGLAHLICVSR